MQIFDYINKYNCCGCGACAQSCPTSSISMQINDLGFKFPFINNETCINCKKCLRVCPTNNFHEPIKPINSFSSKINDDNVRYNSSSGGLFYSFAKKIIEQNGIIFGAWFNEKYEVVMKSCNNLNDLKYLMKSKYVQADTLNTFSECKTYLENGIKVLYVGTPCQINGLHSFLCKDYENLLLVDIACHGVPSVSVWKTYLNKISKGRRVTSVDFRDKKNGWLDYYFTVNFSDGSVFSEQHNNNEYMKLFLTNKILRKSCYLCTFKNEHSCSDITLSDFWGVNSIQTNENDNKGISGVIVKTKKGNEFVNTINNLTNIQHNYNLLTNKNGGFKEKIDEPNDRVKIIKQYCKNNKPKLGIVTLGMNDNIGGELQAYCLQTKLNELGFDVSVIEKNKPMHLDFVDKFIRRRVVKSSFQEINESEFDCFVVGSDQIWRNAYTEKNFGFNFLDFTNKWKNKIRIAYSASFGTKSSEYNTINKNIAKNMLRQFNAISVREKDAVLICKNEFDVCADFTLDPTMLFDEEFFRTLLKNNHVNTKHSGIFPYILDMTTDKENFIKSYVKNKHLLSYNRKSVFDWLSSMISADSIITDSYHGCLFSLIFNKPFVCFYNKQRGVSRFVSLIETFPSLKGRFVENGKDININLLNEKPSILNEIERLRCNSINYLKNNLNVNL